jgi:hypothetical protein
VELELTRDDLNVLLEAVESWERKDDAGDLMSMIVDGTIGKMASPEAVAEMAAIRAAEKEEKAAAKRNRKERSVLLRAKLLQIRDAQTAAEMVASTLLR